MDRNGLAVVFIFSFLTLADFSDASLISNYRNFAVKKRDSIPGSPVPIPKKSDDKTESDSNSGSKLVPDEPSKENKVSSETEKQTSVENNKEDKDKKLDTKVVNEKSKETKPDSEQVTGTGMKKESDPGSESKPSKEEKPDPKPTEEPKKQEPNPEKKQREEEKKSGSESGKGEDKEKSLDTESVGEVSKPEPAPPLPKDSPASNTTKSTVTEKAPPLSENPVNKKKEDKKEKAKKTDNVSSSGITTDETCQGLRSCTIQKDLIGCIKSPGDGSKVVVVVQNKGDDSLKASVFTEDIGKGLEYEVSKKQSKLISVPVTNGKTSNIVFRGSAGTCTLTLNEPVPEESHFFKIQTYDQLLTPVNGAYLLIFSALVFGGTFACIKFRKRCRQGSAGIRYQELEMGIPDSVSAAELESAEGWDEGWDDDWDDDHTAVKSPVARHTGNISANGLTSRSPNKDGWEEDWDD